MTSLCGRILFDLGFASLFFWAHLLLPIPSSDLHLELNAYGIVMALITWFILTSCFADLFIWQQIHRWYEKKFENG